MWTITAAALLGEAAGIAMAVPGSMPFEGRLAGAGKDAGFHGDEK